MEKTTIAFDMRMMKPFPTGIGNHYINLVRACISQYPKRDYILIINSRCKELVENSFKDCQVRYVMLDINGGSFKQILLTPFIIQKFKKMHFDLLITDPWSSLPVMPFSYMLMVYDLIGFNNVCPVSLKQKLYDRFLFKRTANHATGIIASSKAVKDDVIKFFTVPENTIYIVMPSVAKEYAQDVDDAYIQEIKKKYNLTGKYLLYIGNRRPHKNLPGALEIFHKLITKYDYQDVSFALVGGFDTEKVKNKDILSDMIYENYMNIKDKILFLGKIPSNKEVKALLQGSIGLLHPTFFEGFGLTPLEAMYSHTAVISSNIPPIGEVVGDSALLAEPEDIDSFVKNCRAVIENDDIRNELIQKGEKRSKEITWEKAADSLNSAIASCL